MDKKIKITGQMPSPPEFLTNPLPPSTIESQSYPTLIEEHVPPTMPKTIDFGLYQNAVNDRKQAEMSAAEIYAQYMEVVTFNQKLLRTQRIFDRFKTRARNVYNNALNSTGQKSEEALRARRHQMAVESTLNEFQQENESLRASNRAHEEAYAQIFQKLGQAEAQMESAHLQFQTLAEEFDNRGILLEEADRHIQNYRTQIDQLTESIKEWHDKYSKIRDENLILQNQMRNVQIKEAGVATLNSELATSVTKAQKQIYILEDKIARETMEAQSKVAVLETELERYREQRRVEALLEKSKRLQGGENVVYNLEETEEKREKWNGFYTKWNTIINELTSHSTSIKQNQPKKPVPTMGTQKETELISEAGDLEIL